MNLLRQMVQRSKLLSEERKEHLCNVIPLLTDDQKAHLQHILASEATMIQEDAASVIYKVVAENDSETLEQFEQFLHDAERTLRIEDEKAERAQNTQDAQSFFSDVA